MQAMKNLIVTAVALLTAGQALAAIEPLRALAQRGGAIEPGRYICRQQYNASGYTEKVVEIVNASSYVWVASKRSTGSMKTDAKSGSMQFTGGPLGNGFEGVYGKRENGYPVFILIDRDLAPKADAYDLCVRSSGK